MTGMGLAPVEQALEAIANGRMVVVVDDEKRENEGDLIMAADLVTPEAMAFFVRHTSGVICVALPGERCDALWLPPMVAKNEDARRTAFTVSVDASSGVSTGISAADRARTVRVLADERSQADDLARPGHIFPLRYEPGGVLRRPGHTEAAVDLARLAGRAPAGALCEIVKDDGGMARLPELLDFARRHDLPIISIADLIAYRRRRDSVVRRVSMAQLPTAHGVFTAVAYQSLVDGIEHMALVMGDVGDGRDVLARVHSECLTGDIFGSRRCDCGEQLDSALRLIAGEGRGVLVYLRGHEGRGIGLGHKLRAYALQEQGRDTVEANVELGFAVDARDYSVGAHILRDLGALRLRLMTNNPDKRHAIAEYGLKIVERVPLFSKPTPENRRYMETKRDRLGHLLDIGVAPH